MKNKPNYGLDAPAIVKRWGFIGICALTATILISRRLPDHWGSSVVITLAYAGSFTFLAPAITIVLGSLVFKFRDREWLFSKVSLSGNETVLDVGCGHGLLLIGAAKRLTTGKALGLDLWVQEDQARNSREATLNNARIEGVESKVEIHNGDMRQMPFADASIDVVVSSWAIHNIYVREERERALSEIGRVLKPGGKIAILDIDHAPSYRDYFLASRFDEVKLLGPHFTFGNPTYLVTASKPHKT